MKTRLMTILGARTSLGIQRSATAENDDERRYVCAILLPLSLREAATTRLLILPAGARPALRRNAATGVGDAESGASNETRRAWALPSLTSSSRRSRAPSRHRPTTAASS